METDIQTNQETQEATGISEQSQATEAKMLSQDEVNRIVADRVDRERKKFEKRFEGVDLEHYRQLTEAEEARRQEDQKKRGEFEAVLKDAVSKKETQINQLRQELQTIKVDGAMINAASTARAVNPEQVVRLLKDQVRLVDSGDVEVVDPRTGQVRYNESGDPMSMSELVQTFLTDNPHFVAATPAGSGTQGNARSGGGKAIDPAKLDLNDPVQRAQYADWRKQNYTNVRKIG